jgi:hypothetical protein
MGKFLDSTYFMADRLTKTIQVKGLTLVVTFQYEKGMRGDYLQPDDPDVIEIEEILHKEEDITEVLLDSVILEIETELYKKMSVWN